MFLRKDGEKWDWEALMGISKELMMSYFLNWVVGLRVFFSPKYIHLVCTNYPQQK